MFKFINKILEKRGGLKEYQEKIKLFLNDNKLSESEKIELNKLKDQYGLSEVDVKKLHIAAAESTWQYIKNDQRITEDEKNALNALTNYFGVDTKSLKFNQLEFNKYYSLALIDKGILPKISKENHNITILFKKGETLHYGAGSVLRKLKNVTNRINYGGLTGSIKIMKGLHYRVGSIKYGTESKEILASVDTGAFYITNFRIGFHGSRKQFAITFNKLHSLEAKPEGLYIYKEGKETPYIVTLDDYEVALALISFILNQEKD